MSLPKRWTKSETWIENQQNYNGDYKLFLKSERWDFLKWQAFNRTNGKCANCGDKAVHCHHLHYQKPWGEEDPHTDLEPLCKECHEWKHGRSFVNKGDTETLDEKLKRYGWI